MNSALIDWSALERLRAVFLATAAGHADYWQEERDLASYDATFAQRIGWKWDFVLAELRRRGWTLPRGPLLDWGCGSGIAGRAVLDFFGLNSVGELWLWDRSPLAMNFAVARARQKYAGFTVKSGLPAREGEAFDGTLLLSHVLTELDAPQLDSLLALVAGAVCVLWIEPGTHAASRALGAVRERLREHFGLVAPCPHQGPCGLLQTGQERHWCHHFAEPAPGVFTDGDWARFATATGIDLRSLPLSYLVLDRRAGAIPAFPSGTARVIGQPRTYKAHACVFACDATGVRDRELGKRAFPELFRRIRKGVAPSLLELACDAAGKITEACSLDGEAADETHRSGESG